MNTYRGEVEIELDGQKWIMRPTFQAMQEIESLTGTGMLLLANKAIQQDIGYTEAAVIITAGMKAAGETRAERNKVGQMIFDAGLVSVLPAIAEFLKNSLSGGESPGEAAAASE